MKRAMMALMIVAGCMAFAGTASAQDNLPNTQYTFTDDLVEGDLMRPDGDMALVRSRRAMVSLIRIRDTFVPEMLKSVENL